MQYFVAPLNPSQQTTQSLRSSQYKAARKRKRDEDREEPPVSNDVYIQNPSALSNAQSQRSFASFNTAETEQLRVAGLLPEDDVEVPAAPFPHAPAPTSKERSTPSNVQKELGDLDPPIYVVNATSKSTTMGRYTQQSNTLKQTHLGIVTTILHHSLLDGDYHRAGRAWSMLMRSQVAGKPIDLRYHGRWGVGAEILLHRNLTSSSSRAHDDDPTRDLPEDLFSEEGFQLARDYYERLIVQYPTRKAHSHSIDELTFYPAMFSLWIFEVVELSKRARQQMERNAGKASSDQDSSQDDASSLFEDTRAQHAEIRDDELKGAREIADRLDQLLISPPFDKNPDLLQMRGMVGLWMGDLIIEDQRNGVSDGDFQAYSNLQAPNQKVAEKRAEVDKAQWYFQRAKTNSGRLWKGVGNIGSLNGT